MKTILLTLISILLTANTSLASVAQERVRNGDPGLAIANADDLPQADVITRLLAAFEKGAVPDLDLLDGSKNNEYWKTINYFYAEENGAIQPREMSMSFTVKDFRPVLGRQVYLSYNTLDRYVPATVSNGTELVLSSNKSTLYVPSTDFHFRSYLNSIIAVQYPQQDGKCPANSGKNSYLLVEKYNICAIFYFYKKVPTEINNDKK
jgi:hypothetical protein